MSSLLALSASAAACTQPPVFRNTPAQARREPEPLSPLAVALAWGLVCTLAPMVARAQTTPDPSLLMQEQLRRIESGASTLNTAPKTELPSAPRSTAPEVTTTVHIREIQFSRSAMLSDDDLRGLAGKYVGRDLSSADLQQLLDAIAELYQSKGILTALGVLPQQDLKTGLLRVLLVEGRLGEVAVKAEESLSVDWVKTWFNLPAGEVIASEQLRQRLVLFNLASDFNAQAQFVPGAQFGISDLAVEVTEPARLQTWAMADTYPGQTDAKHSLALGLRWAPVTARGGRLDAAVLGNEDGRTVTGAFSMPIGVEGWRAGLNAAASRSTIRVVSTTADPDIILKGTSESLGAELEHTWVLSAPYVLNSSVSVGSLRSKTQLAGFTLAENQLDKLALAVRISHETATSKAHLRTSLVTARSAALTHSYLDTSGQWRQALDARGQWQFRVAGQLRTNDRGQPGSSDAFAMGGQDSLRGFSANALSGSSGHAIQLELRRPLTGEGEGRLETFVFLDSGRTKTLGTSQQAESIGLGFQAQVSEKVGVDATLSHQTQGLQGQTNRLNLRLVATW